MEEDTNMEGSAPASPSVHADAVPMDVDFERLQSWLYQPSKAYRRWIDYL
ncbi:hypothetical protein PR003_g7076 [Phytophthora rubi]|uniref:Uncharacterized protein n=1 Tax=Phytophthora rubi TaxID=129364 RepID=A0A6A3MY97_9STRA|nr:hypothetical protein PR001_g15305 [Phytophthora rubi]KAE9036750.1 hypothetical protein PR002_g6934 [Phytophthora rubi]KAE9347121.1 hypothetical protein PR003_g7076 [Phytophthora rubi]